MKKAWQLARGHIHKWKWLLGIPVGACLLLWRQHRQQKYQQLSLRPVQLSQESQAHIPISQCCKPLGGTGLHTLSNAVHAEHNTD